MKIIVTATPWPKLLPEGTEIKETKPRILPYALTQGGKWFERMDNKKLSDDEPDAKFRLYENEYTIIENGI